VNSEFLSVFPPARCVAPCASRSPAGPIRSGWRQPAPPPPPATPGETPRCPGTNPAEWNAHPPIPLPAADGSCPDSVGRGPPGRDGRGTQAAGVWFSAARREHPQTAREGVRRAAGRRTRAARAPRAATVREQRSPANKNYVRDGLKPMAGLTYRATSVSNGEPSGCMTMGFIEPAGQTRGGRRGPSPRPAPLVNPSQVVSFGQPTLPQLA